MEPAAAREALRAHTVQWGTEVGEDGVERSLDGMFEAETEVVDAEPPAEPTPRAATTSDGVRALADATSTDDVAVRVALRRTAWSPGEHRSVALLAAMLEGRILTEAVATMVAAEWYDARRSAAVAAWTERADRLTTLGARVTRVGPVSAVATIHIPARNVSALLEDEAFASVELEGETAEVADAGHWTTVTGPAITGYEAEDLLQTDVFYGEGYEGSGMIGQTEGSAALSYNDHPGFKDNGSGGRRLFLCIWNATLEVCVDDTPDPGEAHATAVASVLIGDLTDGQDPDVFNVGQLRRARSGVARESTLRGVHFSDQEVVFTHPTWGAELVNRSSSVGGDADCTGTGTAAVEANAMYEAGIAYFKSAGNTGHDDPDNCTISAPAAAIGVFPVTVYHLDGDNAEVDYDDPDTLYPPDVLAEDEWGSSRGGAGTTGEGRGRTIVTLATPGMWQYPYAWSSSLEDDDGDPLVYGTDWGNGDPLPESLCCTSSATPAATGAAKLFRQYFEAERGAMDDPALLYTNLLLMGDRTTESAGRTTGAPDNLWGMGKLRLRMFTDEWMDNPWGYATGTRCVDAGTWVTVNIGSGSLSSQVDVLRVVAWWYDSRHGTNEADNDQVAMRLQYTDGTTNYVVSTQSGSDNRRRIHVDAPTAGYQYQVRFYGTDVTADDEGCGTNSMRIYYAWFYEDSARETGEALSHVRPE